VTSPRRTFLKAATASAAALTLTATLEADDASEPITLGLVGCGGMMSSHLRLLSKRKDVQISWLCEVDDGNMDRAAKFLDEAGAKAPKRTKDMREVFKDPSVKAVFVATPDHWHAPATILACGAGKHVYVEKPCSHNPREGELLVAAARKADRRVQMGNQRRSYPRVMEAIQALRDGVIGRVYFAQSWYTNNRPSIGLGVAKDPPTGLDYELWQGPAPRKPFKSNYLHYNWHWFWNWGNGELGNNGVHTIDLCRWGLGVDYPTRVTSAGGRYRYKDDQETPDTHVVSYDFPGGRTITWEGFSCNQIPAGPKPIALFQGETGSLALADGGYTVYDPKGKEVKKVAGKSGGDVAHIANFLAAVRGTEKLNSEIEEGHKSTLLCHLGNIAHRTGRALRCDPTTGRVENDPEAMKLWTREYAAGWEPKV
jgi:predicted dehydrogenase